jgi:hypothetical protein
MTTATRTFRVGGKRQISANKSPPATKPPATTAKATDKLSPWAGQVMYHRARDDDSHAEYCDTSDKSEAAIHR